jgi:hypothetical protein
MASLRLYAVVLAAPAGGLGFGAEGEPVRAVRSGAITALVGETAAPPGVGEAALRSHDAVVRGLAAEIDPLLPARFGEVAVSEEALQRALEPRAGELAAALARVAGCVQMTLRVFGDPVRGGQPRPSGAKSAEPAPEAEAAPSVSPLPGASSFEAPTGPGTHYLLERRRAADQARSLPEIAALRSALAPLLRAERIERHAAGRLLATAYDLIARTDASRYTALVQEAASRPDPVRLALSGPWPPYAFATAAVTS